MYTNPIFIVGAPRSGTTLLQAMLCSSGPYFPIPETHFFSWASMDFSLEGLHSDAIVQILNKLARKARIEFDIDLFNKCQSQKELFETIVDQYNMSGINTFLEKTPRHIFEYQKISYLFPDAHFLCVVREPKNNVASFMGMSVKGKSVFRVALLYNKVASKIADSIQSGKGLLVRYEDIIENTDDELERISTFIDVPLHREGLSNLSEFTPQIVLPHEKWKQTNIKNDKVLKNDENRWKKVLDNKQASLVEALTYNSANQFGYNCKPNLLKALSGLASDMPKILKKSEFRHILSRKFG